MNPNKPDRIPDSLASSLQEDSAEKRQQIERVWALLANTHDEGPAEPSVDAAWSDVLERLDASRRRSDRMPRARSRRRRFVRRGLALTAALAAVIIVWLAYRPVTIDAVAGTQRTAWLPDGSAVELNSESKVAFTRAFQTWPFWAGGTRHVTLEGEAYFKVVSDDRPFVVETADARIEVLGTEFNVRARRGAHEHGTQVTLTSGRLELRAVADPTSAALLSSRGASAEITDGRTVSLTDAEAGARLDHVLAWRQRGFASVDRPLESILNEVERRYALKIAPREGIDLGESMSLFYPRGAAPDQILRDVCLVQECKYRETSRGYALSPAPPAERDSSNRSRPPSGISVSRN